MTTITNDDLKKLYQILSKLQNGLRLVKSDRKLLQNFLSSKLPPLDLSIEEQAKLKLLEISEIQGHLLKWIDLFSQLPKNGNEHFPYASLYEASEIENDVIGLVAFIPTIKHAQNEGVARLIGIELKVNGSANFSFNNAGDKKLFPALYNFKGTWKEAYLLTVKTLQQGWPQAIFPPEFEPLLKK